jgi:hypothetical protein
MALVGSSEVVKHTRVEPADKRTARHCKWSTTFPESCPSLPAKEMETVSEFIYAVGYTASVARTWSAISATELKCNGAATACTVWRHMRTGWTACKNRMTNRTDHRVAAKGKRILLTDVTPWNRRHGVMLDEMMMLMKLFSTHSKNVTWSAQM